MRSKAAIVTLGSPKAIGPYSQAVKLGDFIFISGQIPIDPRTGQLVAGDIRLQTEQIFRNLQAILEAAQMKLDDIVKTTVFLRNLADFQAMNEVYGEFFREPYPARSTIEVSRLPREAAVEIEAIACCGQ
ncbi:MAG: RidA family protein [Elusimicrobia bacterium]|nr:RidA family protein [Elusimicrobiota bacterium]